MNRISTENRISIAIINQPLNNRGDEAAHKALIRTLLRSIPEVRIVIPYPSRVSKNMQSFMIDDNRIDYVSVPFYKGVNLIQKYITHKGWLWLSWIHPALRRYMKVFRHSDWIVNAPGGICMGGFQNWNHLMFLMMADYAKKPIAYVGRSIGPFPTATADNRLFKERSRQLLHHFSFLSLRDSMSEKYAQEMGVEYTKTIDSAYLDDPQVDIPVTIQQLIGESEYMVMVPNLLIWHFLYKNRISKADVIRFFHRIADSIFTQYPQLKIVMLPQTHDYGSYEGDDINIFREIAADINDKRVVVVPDTYSSDVQQCIIRQAKFMVGARYHSIVFAINNNVPFIALSYEHKIAGMLETLGKQTSCIDITHSLDSKESIDSTLSLFEDKIKVLEPDAAAMEQAKSICFNGLNTLIEKMKRSISQA